MAFQRIGKDTIVGGMFGLPESVVPKESTGTSQWMFLDESNLFLANARSGIMILIDMLKPSSVWMPSYLCPTMLVGVDQKKTALKFYEVDCDLRIPSGEWTRQVQADDIVVLIDYFGFPLDANVAHLVKERGAWVLEDACQALLSEHVGQHSDFVLFSPRKFIGVPDGGIVVSRCDVKFDNIGLMPAPTVWWMKMLEAAINRREFDQHGGERRWYQLFQETERTSPCGYFTMSALSKALLHNCFNYNEIKKQRRENYLELFESFESYSLRSIPNSDEVPLGFAIVCRDLEHRDDVRQQLFSKQIYPPLHWPIHDHVPCAFASSHELCDRIMTIPCDQRYSRTTIERVIRELSHALTA